MSDQTIQCTSCGTAIPLTEALSSQIKGQLQAEMDAENKKKEAEMKKQLDEIKSQQDKLEEQKKSVEKEVEEKMNAEKTKMWAIAQKKAEEKIQTELKDTQNEKEEMAKKLRESEQNELEMRKKTRELEEQKRNLDLEMQRKIDDERSKIVESTKKEEAELNRMKLLEKDKQMDILKKTIEDLKRQSEQGSQQAQGDAQEEDLKNIIQHKFPMDQVDDVPAGVKGADLIQTVRSSMMQDCGIILWESKNTKSWSNDWVKKLKQDQGIAKADICILVSRVLPDGINGFGQIDGVWVVEYSYIFELVSALRYHLLEVERVKKSLVGKDEKMEFLYKYLSGSEFKNRVENIVLGFSSLKSDLETEKRSMQRIWNKREKEIEKVILNTAGMYGDMQGIIGASLPAIQSLELPEGEETLPETDTASDTDTPETDTVSDTDTPDTESDTTAEAVDSRQTSILDE